MKTIFPFLLLLTIAQVGFAQSDSLTKLRIVKDLESTVLSNANDTANYLIGLILSKQIEELPKIVTIDDMVILKGFMAGQENNAFFTFNEANDMLTKMFASPNKVVVEDAADVAENELNEIVDDPYVRPQAKMSPEEMVFFAKNSKREGVMTTMSSKIQYELVLGNGRGASPIFSDRVSVFYFAKYEKDGEIINVEKESFLNIDYQEEDWQEIFQL